MSVTPPTSFQWRQGAPQRLEHSSVKHDLLRSYLRDYLSILTNVPKRTELRLTLFDGFAGGGSFMQGSEQVSGTPLIMAEEVMRASALAAAERNITFNIDLWAVERDPQNFQQLRDALYRANVLENFPGRIHLRNSSYDKALAEALVQLKSVKGSSGRSIFLFDQTGFGQVDLEHVRAIFDVLRAPEVILTFSVSWLVDLATRDPTFLKKVSRVGIRPDELSELLSAKEDWAPRYGGQRWIRQYITDYIRAPFNTCFFLRSRPSNRDIWLLHFAKQWRARDAMMEVHYKFSNKTHFYGKAGLEMLGFDPNSNINQMDFNFTKDNAFQSSNALLQDLPKALKDRGGGEGIRIEDVFSRELNDATLTYKMFERGAVLARDNGLIDIFTAEGRPRMQAKWLNRNDLIKLPNQSSFWPLFTKTNVK